MVVDLWRHNIDVNFLGFVFAMVLFFLCVDIVGTKGWNKPVEVKDKRR
jgi:hypothetical protein